MCACILHNILIERPVPQDWLDRISLELDEDDKLNQLANYSNKDKRHSQYSPI